MFELDQTLLSGNRYRANKCQPWLKEWSVLASGHGTAEDSSNLPGWKYLQYLLVTVVKEESVEQRDQPECAQVDGADLVCSLI